MTAPTTTPAGTAPLVRILLPVVAVAFVMFLVTGVALPVLPMYVHGELGFGTFVVGLVAGAQFSAALVFRFWSGRYADARGPHHATAVGLVLAAVAGLLYLLSLAVPASPVASVTVLIVGRGVLGAAESCVVTGALAWGLALAGSGNAGKVMSWVGLAMYVALAVGAPLGTALYVWSGFRGVALATVVVPVAGLLLVTRAGPVPSRATSRTGFTRIVRTVWMPGLGLAASSLGFGAITTFIVLLFARAGWARGWLGLSIFFSTFVLGRLVLGHVPDRAGGARVALVSALVEASGLACIWLARGPAQAFAGAALTGIGYALVYPGFGVEAVRRAPAESRGLAMGAYTAFLDLALGVGTPVLGHVARFAGLGAVFLVSSVVVASAALIALGLDAREGVGSQPGVPAEEAGIRAITSRRTEPCRTSS